MEEFAQSSGDAGIVVFTLGSMIKNIMKEKSNMIASALAQIPQKVRLFQAGWIKIMHFDINSQPGNVFNTFQRQ